MGFITDYFNKSKREDEARLEELLNKDIFDIDANNIKDSGNIKVDYTKDEADEIMLATYDKKSFLKELKRQIKPQVLDDMSKSLSGKTKEELEEERKQEIKEKTKDIKDPLKLEEELKNEDDNETKDSLALRSEMIKAVYMNTAKEYYKLVLRLQESSDGQIRTGSIVNGTKYDNKILMYQLYMRKLDLWYRTNNHGMPIGFDEEIKETLQNMEYRKAKNDSITNSVREKQIKRIEQLNQELENIEEKMVQISNNEDNNFGSTKQLELLKKEYASKKLELTMLSPSIGLIHAENVEQEKNEEMRRKLGLDLDNKYSSRIYGQKVESFNKKQDYNKNKNMSDASNVIHDDMIADNISKVEEAIEKFDEAMSEQRYEDAIQSISAAGAMLATASDIYDVSDDDMQIFENAKLEVERIKRKEIEEERNNSMGIGAVYTEDEVFAKDVADALYSKRDKYAKEAQRIRNNNERCR